MSVSLVTIGTVALIASAGTAANAQPGGSSESARTTEPSVELEEVKYSHSITLTDAVEEAERYDEQVVSIAWENPGVFGSFALNGGETLNEYLASVRDDFDTIPQATSMQVITEAEDAPSTHARAANETGPERQSEPEVIAVDAPRYDSAPAAKLADHLSEMRASDEPTRTSQARAAAPEWRPYSASTSAVTQGNKAVIYMAADWKANEHRNITNGYGIETKLNLFNSSVATPDNMRPACFDTRYKERFWAVNAGYSITVADSFGSATGLGGYADVNDLSDPCKRNSMSVGIRYPKKLTSVAGGRAGFVVSIRANRGLVGKSPVEGVIQYVSDQGCKTLPKAALTDCMGTLKTPGGWKAIIDARNTASPNRGWTAPNLCFVSEGYGLIAPRKYAC